MPFQIVHNDISKMTTDAIVNAANSSLEQGGGVCGAIFTAAGAEQLKKECAAIGGCDVGHAVITKGYQLPAKYIIHAVGPVWRGGAYGEEKLLAMAYRSSLELAVKYQLESISFPLISSGIYGYPKDKALQVAVSVISEFLPENDMDIYLVVFDRKAIALSEKLFKEIDHYIDSYYDDSDDYENRGRRIQESRADQRLWANKDLGGKKQKRISRDEQADRLKEGFVEEYKLEDSRSFSVTPLSRSLEDVIGHIDETFSEMLFRLIDEKGRTDVEVYKRANIDRKLFSKMRHKTYQPKKSTALALAIALELSVDETVDLLMKAGYSLSNSNRFDLIIRYFIESKCYDIYVINEALFAYEQPLLGA